MKEGTLFLTDVDERRLDAGKHGLDSAEIDVTDGATVIGTVN